MNKSLTNNVRDFSFYFKLIEIRTAAATKVMPLATSFK